MRIYDGYDTPDYVQVSYPNRSGVQSFGPTGGVGLTFDTHPRVNAVLESTYTHLLEPGTFESNPRAVYFPPTPESGLGMVMAVRGRGRRALLEVREPGNRLRKALVERHLRAQPSSRLARPMSGRRRVGSSVGRLNAMPALFQRYD